MIIPHTHRKKYAEEHLVQVEQNGTMIHKIHVSLKFDQEEIRKLQEKDPHYTKFIQNMKLK